MTSNPHNRKDEMTDKKAPEKVPMHIATATRHMVKQRDRAIAIRDKADAEVKKLDAALAALGCTD